MFVKTNFSLVKKIIIVEGNKKISWSENDSQLSRFNATKNFIQIVTKIEPQILSPILDKKQETKHFDASLTTTTADKVSSVEFWGKRR